MNRRDSEFHQYAEGLEFSTKSKTWEQQEWEVLGFFVVCLFFYFFFLEGWGVGGGFRPLCLSSLYQRRYLHAGLTAAQYCQHQLHLSNPLRVS